MLVTEVPSCLNWHGIGQPSAKRDKRRMAAGISQTACGTAAARLPMNDSRAHLLLLLYFCSVVFNPSSCWLYACPTDL